MHAEPACPLCGATPLLAFCELPDAAGEPTPIGECPACHCFVPRAASAGDGRPAVTAQVDLHEELWLGTGSDELRRLENDLLTLVGVLAADLGSPDQDNVVIELGSGRGALLSALRRCGYRAYGCEASPQLVALARQHYPLADDALVASEAQAFLQSLPGRGLRPRVAILWHVLEHLEQPLSLLRELVTACGPGGRIVLQTPLLATPYVFSEHYFLPSSATAAHVATRLGVELLRTEVDHSNLYLTWVLQVPQAGVAASPPAQTDSPRAEPLRVRDQALALQRRALADADAHRRNLETQLDAATSELQARAATIAAQGEMIDERWLAMQAMGAQIALRDTSLRQRDRTIAAQAQLIDERWESMQQMGQHIADRDQTIARQSLQLQQHEHLLDRLRQHWLLGRLLRQAWPKTETP